MTVYNKKSKTDPPPPGAVYIGRPSMWGNPYPLHKESDRDKVCDAFEVYAERRLRVEPTWLDPLIGKDLVCFCAPRRCHGDTLARLAELKAEAAKVKEAAE